MFGGFFGKKSPLVFSPTTGQVANNLNSRAVCIRFKKFKCSKIPKGGGGGLRVLVSGPWTIKSQV